MRNFTHIRRRFVCLCTVRQMSLQQTMTRRQQTSHWRLQQLIDSSLTEYQPIHSTNIESGRNNLRWKYVVRTKPVSQTTRVNTRTRRERRFVYHQKIDPRFYTVWAGCLSARPPVPRSQSMPRPVAPGVVSEPGIESTISLDDVGLKTRTITTPGWCVQ